MSKTAEDYNIVNGVAYHKETRDEVVKNLDYYKGWTSYRLIFWYGDTKTGRAWGDKVTGRLGRSTGSLKVPLVIHNARSLGGEALLDHCIVRIQFARGKGDAYRHPNFHHDDKCAACNAPRPDWVKPCPKCKWP